MVDSRSGHNKDWKNGTDENFNKKPNSAKKGQKRPNRLFKGQKENFIFGIAILLSQRNI